MTKGRGDRVEALATFGGQEEGGCPGEPRPPATLQLIMSGC